MDRYRFSFSSQCTLRAVVRSYINNKVKSLYFLQNLLKNYGNAVFVMLKKITRNFYTIFFFFFKWDILKQNTHKVSMSILTASNFITGIRAVRISVTSELWENTMSSSTAEMFVSAVTVHLICVVTTIIFLVTRLVLSNTTVVTTLEVAIPARAQIWNKIQTLC